MKKRNYTIPTLSVFTLMTLAGSVHAMDMMDAGKNMSSHMMMVSETDLSYGSRGDGVVNLQSFLETKGLLAIPAGVSKGYFGPLTRAALTRYQASVGISATGYFGPLTRANLKSMMAMAPETSMSTETGVMVGGALMVASKDIVDNAVNASNVTTVVAAVKAAGLVDTLKSKGPFTVFAPDNAAFAKLPAGTVDTLIKPENKATLTDILTYHVVAGKYLMSDLTDGLVLKTVEGKTLLFTRVDGKLYINGVAMIETGDVISSNGVTHVIDTVLSSKDATYADTGVQVGGALMVASKDIVDNALNAKNVTTVVAAVKAAGLVDTLKSKGPFTVFAPDNAAFAKLPAGTVDTLLMTKNLSTLKDILTYHVVAGAYTTADLMNGQVLTTVEGKTLTIKKVNGVISINGSVMIETPNVISSNGVTHVIDTVLMPPTN
jgi:transforming growth factor-beta-induced protein